MQNNTSSSPNRDMYTMNIINVGNSPNLNGLSLPEGGPKLHGSHEVRLPPLAPHVPQASMECVDAPASLQEKYHEILQEREFYISTLRDTKHLYHIEISRLQRDLDKNVRELTDVKLINGALRDNLDSVKEELKNTQYEMDVLQVDFHSEREKAEEYHQTIKDFRKKYRNAQLELNEADKASTKRHNRLVEKIEGMEKERTDLQKQISGYESDLESIGILCFLCRAGVKTQKCSQCVELFCKKCYNTIEKCPFCRKDIEREGEYEEMGEDLV